MAYFVEIYPDIRSYIEAIESLSRTSKRAVFEALEVELGKRSDDFLELYPLGHESLKFGYDYAVWEGNDLHTFEFIVDGTEMASGVVRVVFVDHQILREPDDES